MEDRIKAIISLHYHLRKGLTSKFFVVKDSLVFKKKKLKEKYDHSKAVILPKVYYDWMYLHLQDCKFTIFV